LSDTGTADGLSGGFAYRLFSQSPTLRLPDVRPSMYLDPSNNSLKLKQLIVDVQYNADTTLQIYKKDSCKCHRMFLAELQKSK